MSLDMPEERTVEVQGLSEEVDEELLCLYFENKRRSGGGPLVTVQKMGTRAVLVFEDAEAAARVLAKDHHVLHNVELSVSRPASKDPRRLLLRGVNPSTSDEMVELFVENMLGLSVEDYSLQPAPGRDFILIHLNQPLSKDFQRVSAAVSKRTLDGARVSLEQIEQTDSVLVENLQPGASPDLLALYFESSRGGGQRVREVLMLSEATAKVSFANHESVDHVLEQPHKLDGAELELKPHFDFLQPVEAATPPRCESERPESTATNAETAMDAQTQNSPPVKAHSSPSLPPLSHQAAVEVAAEAMDYQTVVADILTTHVSITDPLKRALFGCSSFQQDLQKAHPNWIIQLKDDGVHVAGNNRLQLEKLKQRILDFISSMAETKFTLQPEMARCLAREDVKQRLLEALRQSGSPAVYSVSDANVAVASLSQDAAQQACSFLKSQVCHFSVPVSWEHEGLLCCREWTEFLEALSFSVVTARERAGDIDGWTLKGMEDDKQAAILQFLSTPIERETVISMEPGMLKYIQTHRHQLMADMDQVSIFPLESEDVCGLKIHGPAVACQMAEEVLQSVVASLFTKTITVNAPGVSRFLIQQDCKSILQEMQTKFEVHISTRHVPWKPIPYEGFFEYAWSLMSQKNFSKASADGAPPKTNGASDKEKKLVSALDGNAQEIDQLFDMDNLDLYTAGEPSELRDDVEAVQPCGGQNSVSGAVGLPDDMEEDAQLSLAIQRSMESSQLSIKDEEEQLQRALELSRSMSQSEILPVDLENAPRVNCNQEEMNKMPLAKAIEAANTVQLVVFAGYSSDLLRVEIAFNKKVSQRQAEERVEHRRLRNMSEYHRKCLEVLRRKHGVDIGVQGSIITVSGFKDFVPLAMVDVKLLLEKMSTAISDQEIQKAIQWVWHDPASSDATPYSAEANVFIENAWKIRQDKVDVLFDNRPYTINFERMQEYDIGSGKSVKISRTLRDLGDLNENVPEEEFSLISNLPEASKVDEVSDEFQSVVKQFYETIQEYHSKIRIIQVERLTNRLLYNQYKLKKASVLQRATFPEIERTLYHGTSESSVKEICIHGFNRSFCGKNATVYGQGVYFAVNSSLSVQDQYSPPNADGYKFVFVSKVLTGDYTKGCSSMKTAPLKETEGIPLRYDSVTDNITRPSMFVIFNDTQAFPEYLVTCQKIHR